MGARGDWCQGSRRATKCERYRCMAPPLRYKRSAARAG